jgi:DNA repair exonuclease SbcCD ATPase subunit
MDNYHSEQPFSNELEKRHSVSGNTTHAETIKPDIRPHPIRESTLSSEVMEVSVVEDNESPLNRDWFNLARKLRGQNRKLLDTVVKLEQAVAESRQQLQEYREQSRHYNSLTSEQTSQLQSLQAQNNNLLEQLQVSQNQAQQQQHQIEFLEEQKQTLQSNFAKLERECALLKEEGIEQTNQLIITKQQISELEQRLQRQQRYSLQYKAALDECLSSNAKKIQYHELRQNSNSPNIVAIQPWSSPQETQTPPKLSPSSLQQSSQTPSVDPIDETLEALFSLTPDQEITEEDNSFTSEPQNPDIEAIEPKETTKTDTPEMMGFSSTSLLVSSSVPFSFSIERDRKEEAAKGKVDLPSFLRRQS